MLTRTTLHYDKRMSNHVPAVPADDAEAQRLVGSYLQDFAQLEAALDDGIGKLLGFDGSTRDIVCSSLPFAKKVQVFFSAENYLATVPEAERRARLKDASKRTFQLNDKRVIFAHCAFASDAAGAVTFRRVVANGKLSVSNVTITSGEVQSLRLEAQELAVELVALVEEMKPFVPSLDFSDPRNSMYLGAVI